MKKIFILLLFFVGFFGGLEVECQIHKVKVLKIEVDSKVVTSDFQLFIYKDGHKVIPVRDDRSFEVPREIIGDSPVSVQIKFKRFDLWFYPIYPSKFSTNWIVGVDKKPFDKENLRSEKAGELRLIYFLQFVSEKGDDTRIVVTVKKKKETNRDRIRPRRTETNS